jgi:streptomycin 3"-adenylyltransferase
VAELRRLLGERFVGAYLHGSVAMGSYEPGRSDVDVLGVCRESLGRSERMALADALSAVTRTSPEGLEFSLLTEEAARSASSAPPFEVHVSTHDDAIVDGGDRPGDPDLIVHFAVVRARGYALAGPDPKALFREPDRKQVLGAFLDDLRWARAEGAAIWEGHPMPELAAMAYRVLNAARTWRYVETGELGSKVEGAAWAREHDEDERDIALVDAALAYQHGGSPEPPDDAVVESFVGGIEARLQRALA